MPIILDNSVNEALSSNTSVITNIITPKYFSDTLTGNGKGSRGLLNDMMNPVNMNGDWDSYLPLMSARKKSEKIGDTKTEYIPFDIINKRNSLGFVRLDKEKETIIKVAEVKSTDFDMWVSARPVNMIHETVDRDDVKSKKTIVNYEIAIWCLDRTKTDTVLDIKVKPYINTSPVQSVYITNTTNLKNKLVEVEDVLTNDSKLTVDHDSFDEYLTNFNLYDEIAKQASRWVDDTAEEVNFAMECVLNNMGIATAFDIIKRLEMYKIELAEYIKIQKFIKQNFNENDAKRICKTNLQILLADTLGEIENQKHQIVCFKNDPHVAIDPKYSVEQREAITCEEPLIITQATAGSGKSTTLNARIKHMVACGVEPKDITVLSFSNAAADHMKELNDEIHSQTIASMVHEIYELNYPNNTLSNLDTISNLIDIKLDTKNDNIAYEFQKRTRDLAFGKAGSFAEMNLFVEENFDKVMQMIDTIGQISLELEIIITYQNLMNMTEPDTVICKHLIIDEVQDNSVFEFIFTLKYLEKHHCSLFIVGRSNWEKLPT